VSGGSIAAAMLALRWPQLIFGRSGNSVTEIVAPIRRIADVTIDEKAILGGAFIMGTAANRVAAAYRRQLFGNATLQDLPQQPRFVINATNVQTAALFRFSREYAGDHRIGLVNAPTIELAIAVAASSAFPPFLSPLELELTPGQVTMVEGADLHREPYTTRIVLTDGGVYDNLALEFTWKRYKAVLVSDGGGHIVPEPKPKRDWLRHTHRILETIDNQVRSLRKRELIEAFVNSSNPHTGTYWGIRSQICDYGLPDVLPCPSDRTLDLAQTPTRLQRIDRERQERLINWGYAVCDAAVRRFVEPTAPPPAAFPYPATAV
jgi:NTE family protein